MRRQPALWKENRALHGNRSDWTAFKEHERKGKGIMTGALVARKRSRPGRSWRRLLLATFLGLVLLPGPIQTAFGAGPGGGGGGGGQPPVIITHAQQLDVTEGGESGKNDYYEVKLRDKPDRGETVTVEVYPDSQVGVRLDEPDPHHPFDGWTYWPEHVDLTFTRNDYDHPHKVYVIAFDDTVHEADPHSGVIRNICSKYPGEDNEVTVAVHDNDPAYPGTLSFNPAVYRVDEACGTVEVTVTRTGGSDGAVSVDYADAGSGTATAGSDYAVIPAGTLSWADGDASPKTITVSVIDDSVYEPDETIDLVLTNVRGGAALGSSQATVTILKSDEPVPQPEPRSEDVLHPPGLSGPFMPFSDMSGHWAADSASLLARLRVIAWAPGAKFNPTEPVTRAEFLQMLVRVMGCPTVAAPVPFNDVRATDRFYSDVAKAIHFGILTSGDGTAFRPNDPITRQEAAVMLARALVCLGRRPVASDLLARLLLARFRDAGEVAGNNAREVALTTYAGMMLGRSPTALAPGAGLTRAEAAQALGRLWYLLRTR